MTGTVERGLGVGDRPRRPVVLGVAWLATFVGTMAPRFVTQAVFGVDPPWILWVQLAAIGGFLALTVAAERFRGLRVYGLAMLAAQLQFYVTWSPVAALLGAPVDIGPSLHVANELTQFLFTVALLVVLVGWRYDRDDLFLRPGDLSAPVEGATVPGLGSEPSWRSVGPLVGGAVVLLGAGILLAGGASVPFAGTDVPTLLGLLAVVVVAAALNAFSEEFVYRSAPAADLLATVGKRQALLLLAAFFGLSHYYGTPGGPGGVLLTGAFAWVAAKSILETRGIGVAFLIHFAADLVVASAYLG